MSSSIQNFQSTRQSHPFMHHQITPIKHFYQLRNIELGSTELVKLTEHYPKNCTAATLISLLNPCYEFHPYIQVIGRGHTAQKPPPSKA